MWSCYFYPIKWLQKITSKDPVSVRQLLVGLRDFFLLYIKSEHFSFKGKFSFFKYIYWFGIYLVLKKSHLLRNTLYMRLCPSVRPSAVRDAFFFRDSASGPRRSHLMAVYPALLNFILDLPIGPKNRITLMLKCNLLAWKR